MTTLEIHTSDLTGPCLRRVELRLNGKASASTESAKFFGLLWGEVAAACHDNSDFTDPFVIALLPKARDRVIAKAKEENSPVSPVVTRDMTDTLAEIGALVRVYRERCVPMIGKFLGCELPIRATFDVDGEPVEFASHLDLLFRDKDGRLVVWDWKAGKDAPSFYELSRNMQFGMYGLACRYGSVMLGDEWIEFEEWPSLYWVHVQNLYPFGRATTTKEWDGTAWTERKYTKGESRPIDKIVIPSGVYPEGESEIMRRFAEHVRMRRSGIMPAIPGEHCMFCDSVRWCENLGGQS